MPASDVSESQVNRLLRGDWPCWGRPLCRALACPWERRSAAEAESANRRILNHWRKKQYAKPLPARLAGLPSQVQVQEVPSKPRNQATAVQDAFRAIGSHGGTGRARRVGARSN